MSRSERNLFWIFIIFTLAVAIAGLYLALSLASDKNVHLTFNAAEALIGVLSILVTLLLGWQIWTAIRVEDRVQQLQGELDKAREALAENHATVSKQMEQFDHMYNSAICSTQAMLWYPDKIIKNYQSTYFYLVRSMSHLVHLGEQKKEAVRSALRLMTVCIDHMEKENLKFKEKEFADINANHELIAKAAALMPSDVYARYIMLDERRKLLV